MKKKVEPLIKTKTPIDLRYKYVKGFFGKRKRVETSLREQRRLKKAFLKIYPDNMFIDNLCDKNSVRKGKENYSNGDGWFFRDAGCDCGSDGCDCSGDD